MKTEIHNAEVANFQVTMHTNEEEIIKGNRSVNNLSEFNEFYKEIKEMQAKFDERYQKAESEKDKQDLNTYLAQELDYLKLMNILLDALENYHDVVGLVDANEIQKEWTDIRLIITFRNIERQLENIMHLSKDSSNHLYEEQQRKLVEQRKSLEPKVVFSLHRVLGKSEREYNSMEVESVHAEDRKNDFEVNELFYNTLNLTSKIAYLELVIANIKKAEGVVTCEINGINIVERYAANYRNYIARLNNLKAQLALEEAQIISTNIVIDKHMVEDYINICTTLSEIAKSILALEEEAREAINTDRVIAVNALDGRNMYILGTRFTYFTEMQGKYNFLIQSYASFGKKYNLTMIQDEKEYNQTKKMESILYNRYSFLIGQIENNPELKEGIKKLGTELGKLVQARKFVLYSNFYAWFRSCNLPENLIAAYTEIFANIDAFVQMKKYTEEEKKKILSDILSILQKSSTKEIKSTSPILLFDEKEIQEEDALRKEKKTIPEFMKEQIAKVKSVFYYLPRANAVISKVKNKKSSKNRNQMHANVKEISPSITIDLAFAVFMMKPLPRIATKKQEVKVEETPLPYNEEQILSIVDKIYDRAKQRQAMQKMSNDSVSLTPEQIINFSKKENDFVYNYKGQIVYINAMDPDCEAKKAALVANGATLVENKEYSENTLGRSA